MHANGLYHAVLYVRDLQASLAFYRDLLGFRVIGDIFQGKAAALVGKDHRTHHELLLIEVGDAPGPDDAWGGAVRSQRRGLYHLGIKVGDSMDELRQAKADLTKAGIAIEGASDHTATWSLYVRDPDGNEVELYCDNPDVDWKNDPASVLAPIKPLRL